MFINNCSLFSVRRVGPSSHIGSLSGSTAVGFGWCCQYRLHKTSCANKYTHALTETVMAVRGKEWLQIGRGVSGRLKSKHAPQRILTHKAVAGTMPVVGVGLEGIMLLIVTVV